MAGLTLDGVSKDFGAARAVDRVSLSIDDGEFLAILGPSGCGKTTLLRLIAGFETVSEGSIRVGDKLVSDRAAHVPPEDRRMGIVFQSYALWPHLSVAENVGYALKVQKLPRPEREARITTALATVGLTGMADRRPASLSGGQRQRVALARCLAMKPSLVLLDEPLANLDVHLRASMQAEFASFHREARTTMVYITHDQAEAMALADRIAVMDQGKVLQVAAPSTLYREPANATVARFIGEGAVLSCKVLAREGEGRRRVMILGEQATIRSAPNAATSGSGLACIRPRGLALSQGRGIAATISRLTYQGGSYKAEARPDAAPELVLPLDLPEPATISEGDRVMIAIEDAWLIPSD